MVLQIVMVIAHLPGIYLYGISSQLKMFFRLSISLTSFFYGFLDILYDFVGYLEHLLLSCIVEPYRMHFFAVNLCHSNIFFSFFSSWYLLLLLLFLLLLLLLLLFLESFSHQRQLMVFHWKLSESKSPQVSRTLLGILADLNNVVVRMVSTCPLICKSSCSLINPLLSVPRAPITIGINVTFMLHSFFNSLARSRYLSFFSFSFSFNLRSAGTAKSTHLQVLFFCCWL